MSNYLLHGKLVARPEYKDELAQILLQASALVSSTKGCILYVISKEAGDANAVWVTEIWKTKEDHDNSLKLENVRALITKAIPMLEGQPQKGQELIVLGGLGAA